MKHPHYEIIKALIEDTSLDVQGRWASGDSCWEKFGRGSVLNDFEGRFEFRTKVAKKEVVSSLTDEELRILYFLGGDNTAAPQDRRQLANAAAARERSDIIKWLRNAYPLFNEAVFINLENR